MFHLIIYFARDNSKKRTTPCTSQKHEAMRDRITKVFSAAKGLMSRTTQFICKFVSNEKNGLPLESNCFAHCA